MDESGTVGAASNDQGHRTPLSWPARSWLTLGAAGVPLASLLPMVVAGFPARARCNDDIAGSPEPQQMAALDRWAVVGLIVSLLLILVSGIGAHYTVPAERVNGAVRLPVAAVLLVCIPLPLAFTPYGYLALLITGPLGPVLALQPFAAAFIASRWPPARMLGYLIAAEVAILAWWSTRIWDTLFC